MKANKFVNLIKSEFSEQYGTRMFNDDDQGLVSFDDFVRDYFGQSDLPDDLDIAEELDTWVADVLADSVA